MAGMGPLRRRTVASVRISDKYPWDAVDRWDARTYCPGREQEFLLRLLTEQLVLDAAFVVGQHQLLDTRQ